MYDRTSSHMKRNCKYCSHGHSETFARNTENAERTETDRRLHVNISHNTSHQTEGKHRYNGVRSRLRQWTSDVPDKPTHTTLGFVFTRTLRNHIRRKTTIECVPSLGWHQCWTWNQSNPKPTPISDMCPTWRTTKHKTLMLQRIESESP